MLARFRRLRLVALVLLLGSPGLGGNLVQVLHPCPVDTPWLAQAQAVAGDAATIHAGAAHTDAAHAGHGAQPADGQRHGGPAAHPDSCSCLSACQAVSAPPAASAAVVLHVAEQVATVLGKPSVALVLPLGTPLDLLPPPIAPPLA